MPHRDGIDPNLLARVRSTMIARSTEEIEDRVPRARFHRLSRLGRVAADLAERDYIQSLPGAIISEPQVQPETSQE